jgi:hypothetical protein
VKLRRPPRPRRGGRSLPRKKTAAALAAALALLLTPAVAGATDVSRDELVSLAEAASSDDAALEELRAVTSVDGAPVDLDTALEGAEGEDLEARLDEVARSAEAAPVESIDAEEARASVEEILENEPEPPPISDGDGAGELEIPSPSLPVAIILALVILAIAALAARGAGQRTILEREAAIDGKKSKRASGRDLSREADEAERRGDFAAAVRLRFQAGLTRLDELGSIELRPSLTASGAVRESGLHAIGGVAVAYERVAFGGREASAGDAETQKAGWSAVVDEARRQK